MEYLSVIIVVVVVIAVLIAASLRVIQQYERGVVFRLGRVRGGVRGAGPCVIIPLVDRLEKVSLRLEAMDVPKQDVITQDNVPVRVNAVVFFKVADPERAVIDVRNYTQVTSQKAQTTLRSVLGAEELDGLLSARDKINQRLEELIGRETEPFGVHVQAVEVKDVELPEGMQRAMARQAEAERERRAKVIAAEGELQAAEQFAGAAEILDRHNSSLQLRYLQTLAEIAAENNSTTIFPIPLEFLRPFMSKLGGE